ncbi:MAG: hypothetical protein LBT01_04205 [Spirochaetaceae bacterium]|jgi:hypothetical protein|nr:hypothetical protein [Spirochaetaceae bacterium]
MKPPSPITQRHLVILLMFFSLAPFAFAQTSEAHILPFEFPSARLAALGGNHAALTDDYYTAFNNPAGFAAVPKKISFAEISAEFNRMEFFWDLYFGTLTDETIIKMVLLPSEANAVIGGPINFGMISNGWGWRVFSATRGNIYWNGITQRFMDAEYSEEVVGNLGYGFRLVATENATLDFGVMLKAFYRLAFLPERTITSFDDLVLAIEEIGDVFNFMRTQPYETQLGAGFDIGIRWTWRDSFSLGLTYKDPYTAAFITGFPDFDAYLAAASDRTGYNTVAPQLGIGLSWRIPSFKLHRYNTDLVFSADYNGLLKMFSEQRNPLLYLSAGLELRLLEVFCLRVGVADCLPSGGIGLNFTYFQFDVAYGGKEMATEPGGNSTWFLSISFLFRLSFRNFQLDGITTF